MIDLVRNAQAEVAQHLATQPIEFADMLLHTVQEMEGGLALLREVLPRVQHHSTRREIEGYLERESEDDAT